MDTALVWFRRDLRVHDHPPLRAALDACERVVPVFVLDERLLGVSENRESFLYACLKDLRESLQQRGGNLVIVKGRPEQELPKLAERHDATAVYFASDVSPFAMSRDKHVVEALQQAGIEPRRTPGNFIADIGKPKPYVVFTPFWKAWQQLPRRDIHGAPRKVPVPADLHVGEIPTPKPTWLEGGETQGRKRMLAWDHTTYDGSRNRLDRDTSLLSPYLHLGAISARELEERSGGAYARQLAWRDFYAHVLCTTHRTPDTPSGESSTASSGRAPTSTSTPGAKAGRASRWSTPGCASSRRPAGCTTAPA